VNRTRGHPVQQLLQRAFWFWARSSRGPVRLAINVSYARRLPVRPVFSTAVEPYWMRDSPQALGGRTV